MTMFIVGDLVTIDIDQLPQETEEMEEYKIVNVDYRQRTCCLALTDADGDDFDRWVRLSQVEKVKSTHLPDFL